MRSVSRLNGEEGCQPVERTLAGDVCWRKVRTVVIIRSLFHAGQNCILDSGKPGVQCLHLPCFNELLKDWKDVPNSWLNVRRESVVHKCSILGGGVHSSVYDPCERHTYLENIMDDSYHFPLFVIEVVRRIFRFFCFDPRHRIFMICGINESYDCLPGLAGVSRGYIKVDIGVYTFCNSSTRFNTLYHEPQRVAQNGISARVPHPACSQHVFKYFFACPQRRTFTVKICQRGKLGVCEKR